MNATSTATEQKRTGSDACPARPRPLRVLAHGQTDPGRVRDRNEDQFLIAVVARALQVLQTSLPHEDVLYSQPQGHLLVVADGVGGHAAGEDASALAVNAV